MCNFVETCSETSTTGFYLLLKLFRTAAFTITDSSTCENDSQDNLAALKNYSHRISYPPLHSGEFIIVCGDGENVLALCCRCQYFFVYFNGKFLPRFTENFPFFIFCIQNIKWNFKRTSIYFNLYIPQLGTIIQDLYILLKLQ